jgi:hypothetical protein
MASDYINKRFSTIETIKRLLLFKNIMFKVIEFSDLNHTSAIPETQFYAYVVAEQEGKGKEKSKEIAVVCDVQNLLKARIINDRRNVDGTTSLLFNTTVFELFRLCKVSLHRPLTKVSLNASMSPLWSISKQIKERRLSTVPGTDDYSEWVDDLIFRVSELLGKIKTNIAKLQNVGLEFEKNAQHDLNEQPLLATRRESFQLASKLFQREIEPLKVFLEKNTRYEDGDGIFLLFEYFRSFFKAVHDHQRAELILSYEVQYLDLFLPIKTVANTVSIYLQKTQQSIFEQSAVDSAFSVILAAYEKTLGTDMRNKYIDLKDLSALDMGINIPSVNRLSPFRADKNSAFLNIAFKEIDSRANKQSEQTSLDVELTENVNKDTAKKLAHAQLLNRWVSETEWPDDIDFVEFAHMHLTDVMPGYTLPDLFEVQSSVINTNNNSIKVFNEYRKIENEAHSFQYRVRHITNKSETTGNSL